MNHRILKIFTATALLLLTLVNCSDENLINTYNKLTEHYRETPEDRLISPDTCITVRVLGSTTGRPMVNTNVVLTQPAGDTAAAVTDKEGFAVFAFTKTEGTYTLKACYFAGGIEYSRRTSCYLYEKNNPTLTIYINENPWYN